MYFLLSHVYSFFFLSSRIKKTPSSCLRKRVVFGFTMARGWINQRVLVPGRVRVPTSIHSTAALQIKKTVLCQKPLTHNRDQIMSHTSVRGYIFQQWVIFIMDEIRKMQYNKQANVDLLTLLPIKYHITHITIHQLQSFMLECIVELCLWSYWKALSTCYWGGNLI